MAKCQSLKAKDVSVKKEVVKSQKEGGDSQKSESKKEGGGLILFVFYSKIFLEFVSSKEVITDKKAFDESLKGGESGKANDQSMSARNASIKAAADNSNKDSIRSGALVKDDASAKTSVSVSAKGNFENYFYVINLNSDF